MAHCTTAVVMQSALTPLAATIAVVLTALMEMGSTVQVR